MVLSSLSSPMISLILPSTGSPVYHRQLSIFFFNHRKPSLHQHKEEWNKQPEEQNQDQDPASCRVIRSPLMNSDSDKFDTILGEFDKLHDQDGKEFWVGREIEVKTIFYICQLFSYYYYHR